MCRSSFGLLPLLAWGRKDVISGHTGTCPFFAFRQFTGHETEEESLRGAGKGSIARSSGPNCMSLGRAIYPNAFLVSTPSAHSSLFPLLLTIHQMNRQRISSANTQLHNMPPWVQSKYLPPALLQDILLRLGFRIPGWNRRLPRLSPVASFRPTESKATGRESADLAVLDNLGDAKA